MNILIAQPRLEIELIQLEKSICSHTEADAFIFPEGYINHNIARACELARKHSKLIISGHKKPRDRAIIIERRGRILLDRAKYDESTLVETEGKVIGLILCDELVIQGMSNMKPTKINFIVHPIGVGMFSEEQFDEWVDVARKVAKQYNTMIIGTSHADGSFRDNDISIPISYCIDKEGKDIFISKNDIRTRILNIDSKEVRSIDEYS